MLSEAIQSVRNQTHSPSRYLIEIDLLRQGAAQTYNRLLDKVDTEWVSFLDDDDLLDPDHLETLVSEQQNTGVDVVYSQCRCEGWDFWQYDRPFDGDLLERISIVPFCSLVRTEFVRRIGGIPQSWGYDWELWKTLYREGASFRKVDRPTWTYRFHGKNQSKGEL